MKLQHKNKVTVLILSMLSGLFLLNSAFISPSSQPTVQTHKKGQSYAVLISQPNHVKAVVNTAGTITAESNYKRDTFIVMACGKSVEAFVKGSDMAEMIRKGKAEGITYKICGMSLQQFNINPETLIEGIEIVPNGLTYMFDLQAKGYKTVEL